MARHELVDKALAMLKPALPPPEHGAHQWWISQWKGLATVTDGLTPEDPRLNPILDALAVCDRHYRTADLDGFEKASQRVYRLMQFVPGARVCWEGEYRSHRLGVLGPAKVEQVICSEGRLWAWVFWQGRGRWVCEAIVSKNEGPKL